MLKKTLILTNRQIQELIGMRQALKIVEESFIAHAQGKTRMPAKIYIHLNKYRGDFRAMPAYIGGMEACGIKWVNVHPENKKHGLPSVMAVIVLNDPKTGFPLAIMDGTYVTNLRTGASGGIAAKYLAN
ncbi:MAG: ornithine cyclodeaminase family protein, partial [Candidatus Omnitrophica bacterium]|nr:ornithine cyclodeaminase family protein [Candidatus Omnitrophota bacterium]